MIKKKKKKVTNLLFDAFIGEHVNITTDMKTTIAMSSEDGTAEETRNTVVSGFFLDMDDEYIFLGYDARQVSRALVRKECKLIEISREPHVFDEILDSMPEPTDRDMN